MMSLTPIDIDTPRDPVSLRASDFLERKRFGEWGEIDQAELNAWLAESTIHRVTYLRVEAAVARTRQLVLLHPEDFSGGLAPFFRKAARWTMPFLAAASIALTAKLGPQLLISLSQPPDRTDSTDVGGRTLLSFSDHTEIELNTATAVRLRMTNKERTVWLEKGEAWFQVAHDAAHPFTVIVGTHRITDLGTEFLIRRDGDSVDVTLLNGRATVSTQGLQTATLTPGEEATATPVSLSVTRKSPQELADELAWRRGMLVFRNTPLADVVREFNRYNTKKLVIADPSVSNVKIYAEIRADRYEGLLSLVRQVLNLRVDREGGRILISRETRKKTNRAAHARRGG